MTPNTPDPAHTPTPFGPGDTADAAIHALLRTAVATAPAPPTVGEVDDVRPFAAVDLAERRRARLVRAAAVLTAAAASIGVLVAVARSGREPAGPAASTAAPAAASGLPGYALPAQLPPGWQIADVVESSGSRATGVEQPVAELFRRTSDGASIAVFGSTGSSADGSSATSVAASVATSVASAVTTAAGSGPAQDGGVTFDRSNFRSARFSGRFAGVSEADAGRFLNGLIAIGEGARTRFTSPDPGWVLESEAGYEPSTPRLSYAALQVRNGDGLRIDVVLSDRRSTFEHWKFGVLTGSGDSTFYVVDDRTADVGSWAANRPVGALAASVWTKAPPTDALVSAAMAIVTSLHQVSADEWRRTADDADQRLAAASVTATLTVGDVTVAHHRGGWVDALCATVGAATTCHQNDQTGHGAEFDAITTPQYPPMAVGSTWVGAGWSDSVQGAPSYPLVASTAGGRELGLASPVMTDDGDGKLWAYLAPVGADVLHERDLANPQAAFGTAEIARPFR